MYAAQQTAPCETLDYVIEQAMSQVKFARKYNALKLENAPSCKLSIDQCHQLLESAQKLHAL